VSLRIATSPLCFSQASRITHHLQLPRLECNKIQNPSFLVWPFTGLYDVVSVWRVRVSNADGVVLNVLTQRQEHGRNLCLPVADATTWVEPEAGWTGERVSLACVHTAVEAAAVSVVRVEAVRFANAEVHCNDTT